MREKLDQIVVDIEFLLISVIQGVALAALAAAAAPIVINLQFEYWPYIISAFLFILIFWSQAIMHVLGFIKWPLDLVHNSLYLLASLVEVMAFSVMTNPFLWFLFISVFVFITGILYIYDFILIKNHKGDFKSPAGKALYKNLYDEQLFDMKVYVPSGIFFTAGCSLLIYRFPQIFLDKHYHIFLVGLQVAFGLTIIVTSLKTFSKRLSLIAKNT